MILEYSYDKANEILALFKDSKIATLDIQEKTAGEDKTYVMEYSLIDSYVEKKRSDMHKVLSNSLPERLRVAELLNDFIEHQSLNNVKEFKLHFNIVDVHRCEVTYSASFGQEANNMSDIQQLQKCLEQYDSIITRMGVSDITVPNIFRKEGSGKNRKNVSLTVKEIGEALRHALVEK